MCYDDKVKETVFSLSENKNAIKTAISEWTYRGKCHYLSDYSGTCGLCGHKGLRYQFTIVNGSNENELVVGSECIKKFEICYFDDGYLIDLRSSLKVVSSDRKRLKERADMLRERETRARAQAAKLQSRSPQRTAS